MCDSVILPVLLDMQFLKCSYICTVINAVEELPFEKINKLAGLSCV